MLLLLSLVRARIRAWFLNYDNVQSIAVFLLYIQIACAMIGSLGAFYTGVLLINLSVSLFALVAIESSSQSLGRTYAVLLGCTLVLDVAWFIFFASEIWNVDPLNYGAASLLSLKIAFWMQVIGCFVRICSSFLWVLMYRLGASSDIIAPYNPTETDSRHGFLSPPSPAPARQTSIDDDVVGGSIYDPAYYSSLFQENQDLDSSFEVGKSYSRSNGANVSPPIEGSYSKSYTARFLDATDNV